MPRGEVGAQSGALQGVPPRAISASAPTMPCGRRTCPRAAATGTARSTRAAARRSRACTWLRVVRPGRRARLITVVHRPASAHRRRAVRGSEPAHRPLEHRAPARQVAVGRDRLAGCAAGAATGGAYLPGRPGGVAGAGAGAQPKPLVPVVVAARAAGARTLEAVACACGCASRAQLQVPRRDLKGRHPRSAKAAHTRACAII